MVLNFTNLPKTSSIFSLETSLARCLQPRVDQLWDFVNSLKVVSWKENGQYFLGQEIIAIKINIVLLNCGHPSYTTNHNVYGWAFSKNYNALVNCKPHLLHSEIHPNSNDGQSHSVFLPHFFLC